MIDYANIVIEEFTTWSEFDRLDKTYTVRDIIKIFENEHNKACINIVINEANGVVE